MAAFIVHTGPTTWIVIDNNGVELDYRTRGEALASCFAMGHTRLLIEGTGEDGRTWTVLSKRYGKELRR